MSFVDRIRTFRELHVPGSPFVMPNAWSPGSALSLEKAGFPAVATSSGALALELGLSDGEVGAAASLAAAFAMAAAVDVPVSADLENCFHDEPDRCASVIARAAALGLAGASIEDATGRSADPIYPIEAAVARVRAAAAAAASSTGLVVTARAENFLHGRADLQDTIARLRAYAEAGADVLFAPGLPDIEAVRAVCAAVDRPVSFMLIPGRDSSSERDLAAARVARISLASSLAREAHQSAVALAESVRAALA